MSDTPVRIRRGRRTDFTAVMRLLAASGTAVPPPERLTLRRFRSLVNDLSADFYLALVDGQLAGFVHVTYARQLAGAPSARIERLVVADTQRRGGVGTALLHFAQQRARHRGCATLSCVPPDSSVASRFLENGGLISAGTVYTQAVTIA
jgi:N-acetylglutamate synthase-like GNAT family acetyltransferase